MEHSVFPEHDEIDMDCFFTESPENLFGSDPSPLSVPLPVSNTSPDSWIDEIEVLLMNNDPADEEQPSLDVYEKFLADVLVGETTDSDVGRGCADEEKATDNDETVDDPTSKKLKRQLRNRDAAVKSRERKKLYVKDLEVKSKYLEGECRRLGRLLQCFMSENHALRLTLQNGSVATMTMQESAVLLMESLLLGSLLWFLGLTCLFNLLDGVVQENVGKRSLITQAPSEPRSKTYGSLLLPCTMRSRRCRASRTRMRLSSTLVL